MAFSPNLPDACFLSDQGCQRTFYGLQTVQGPTQALRVVSQLVHFTDWVPGHVHMGTMGWVTLTAMLVIADVVRKEDPEVVHTLQEMGLKVSIISGDNQLTTASIASIVDTSHALAGVSPVSKKEVIREMQSQGGKIMMVGDGINDAPALTVALIGLALGRGTDIARESADAVLMKDDLRLIPYFIRLSKRTFRIIKQNIFWAFFYNIVAVPLAISGLLHPIMTAGAMAASSLFVVVNSLRIRSS